MLYFMDHTILYQLVKSLICNQIYVQLFDSGVVHFDVAQKFG